MGQSPRHHLTRLPRCIPGSHVCDGTAGRRLWSDSAACLVAVCQAAVRTERAVAGDCPRSTALPAVAHLLLQALPFFIILART